MQLLKTIRCKTCPAISLFRKEDKLIEPLNDRVAVQLVQITGLTNIVIPDTAKHKYSSFGRVVAVGPGNEHTKMSVKDGDIVAFSPINAAKIELGRHKFFTMRMGEIICKVDPEKADVEVEEIEA